MNYKKPIACLMAILLVGAAAFAQQASIKDLKPIFDHLKAMKVYSFENHTNAVFTNGQKDAVVTKVFMDKTKECLFYTNKGETVLLNKKWVYKANHIAKTVQVFDINKYNKQNKKVLPAIQGLFQYDMVSEFLDSVVIKYGKLLSSKKVGGLTTYRIGFAANAALKQLIVIYNEGSQLPESIYIKTVIGAGKEQVQSEVLCNNYKSVIEPSVFDDHTFFSVNHGKVALTLYKNYKVYSLL